MGLVRASAIPLRRAARSAVESPQRLDLFLANVFLGDTQGGHQAQSNRQASSSPRTRDPEGSSMATAAVGVRKRRWALAGASSWAWGLCARGGPGASCFRGRSHEAAPLMAVVTGTEQPSWPKSGYSLPGMTTTPCGSWPALQPGWADSPRPGVFIPGFGPATSTSRTTTCSA